MAGWQDELVEILQELGVTQEEPRLHSNKKFIRREARHCVHSDVEPDIFFHYDTALPTKHAAELKMMRKEVESIVRQVALIMEREDLSPTIREDALIVLHALHKHAQTIRLTQVDEEAHLAALSSLLHFCRLVLAISE
jgi:hypothetical protein